MPSNVTFVKSLPMPRITSFCSDRPGPFTAPVLETLGAIVAMRVYSESGEEFSSMKSRVISE